MLTQNTPEMVEFLLLVASIPSTYTYSGCTLTQHLRDPRSHMVLSRWWQAADGLLLPGTDHRRGNCLGLREFCLPGHEGRLELTSLAFTAGKLKTACDSLHNKQTMLLLVRESSRQGTNLIRAPKQPWSGNERLADHADLAREMGSRLHGHHAQSSIKPCPKNEHVTYSHEDGLVFMAEMNLHDHAWLTARLNCTQLNWA